MQKAISAKALGDSIAYQQICDTLKNSDAGPVRRLKPLISALAKCTASLSARVHHSVVSLVLNNCWRSDLPPPYMRSRTFRSRAVALAQAPQADGRR